MPESRPMHIHVMPEAGTFRMIFSGALTCEHSREIENRIIDALRRHPHLAVDLSGVEQIDSCGLHLLRLLKSFGGEAVQIVAASALVGEALQQLPGVVRAAQQRRVVPPSPGQDISHQEAR